MRYDCSGGGRASMRGQELELLTRASARLLVNEWINSRIEKPKDHAHSQMRWLMRELADLCMELSVGNGESEDQLCERLAAAYDILSLAWYSVAPDYATWRRSEEAELDADEKKRIAIARHILWKRHDPNITVVFLL